MRYGKSSLSNAGSEHIYAYAENWRAFLEEYYGTEVHIGNEMWFDYTMRVALVFSLGTGEDAAEYQLDLYNYFLDGFTTLNPYVQENGLLFPYRILESEIRNAFPDASSSQT